MKKMFSIFLIATVILVSIPFTVTSRTDNFLEKYKTILDIYDSNIVYKKDKTSTLIDNMVNIDGENLSIEEAENLGYKILTNDETDEVMITYPYQTSRIIVKTDNNNNNIDTHNAVSSIRDTENGLTILQYETPAQAKEAEAYYDSLPDTFADPDSIMSTCETNSVSANWFGLETFSGHRESCASEFIHIDDMNDYLSTQKLKNITVAVVDTGVCSEHPDLKDRIICADVNFSDSEQENSEDDQGHGTHVAGIIADNTLDNIVILSVKALDSNGTGTLYQVYDAIQYAVKHGAKVINLSLGQYGTSDLMTNCVKELWRKNISVVAAAGNNFWFARDFTPAGIDECITVAATDNDGYAAEFTNGGKLVDIEAPGVNIYSTWIFDDKYDGYRYASGTSMSAPFVSATAISLYAYDNTYTAKYVHDDIRYNAFDIFGNKKWTEGKFYYGVLDCRDLIAVNRTAIPIPNYKSGNYFEPICLELTCTDENAKIYYTTDGTIASETNGILYTEPFIVDETMRIHMIAYSENKYKSVQSYYDYYIVSSGKEDDFTINSDGVITKINIPDYNSNTIYSIAIPDTINGIPVLGIGDGVFKNDTALKMIVLPNSCKTIGTDAFNGCINLIGIRALGVETIGDYAFSNCTLLQKFDNDTLKNIGKSAFFYCYNLKQLRTPGLEIIPERSFYNCWSLVDIPLQNTIKIDDYAFYKCSSLQYAISNSVKTIGKNAFQYSTVENVSFKNASNVGEYAFSSCHYLKSISLANYKNEIPRYFCSECENLYEVNIPNAISAEAGCFINCNKLEELVLNNAVTIKNCLVNTNNLKHVEFNSATQIVGFTINCEELTIPECKELSYINSSTLERLYLPKCEYIINNIECSNLKYVFLPELSKCGRNRDSNLFKNCYSLVEIRLPKLQTIEGHIYYVEDKTKSKLKRVYAPLINESKNYEYSTIWIYMNPACFKSCTIIKDLPQVSTNDYLELDASGYNVYFDWYYSATGARDSYVLISSSIDTSYYPTKAGFYYCILREENQHKTKTISSNLCRYGDVCKTIGHTFNVDISNHGIDYKCKYCDEIQTHNPDEILSLWNTDYLNKPVPQVSSENSHYLDVVQDGVINAKDYAKLKQESKHS